MEEESTAEKITETLEDTVAAVEETKETLSEHWRRHTNRRTIVSAVIAGTLALLSYLFVVAPPENFPTGELVNIPEGATLSEASVLLENNGVVRSSFAFKAVERLFGREGSIHAGDYFFKEPRGLFSVAYAVGVGQYGLEPIRIRVPEGATTRDMARIFGSQLPRFDTAHFLSRAPELEGYLFPDTYFFMPNANDETVASAMRQNFDTKAADIMARAAERGVAFDDVVTLASLIEREARNSADRRMISGVLWNRLDRGMLLQVDAAFLYTLGKGTFDLTLADLQSDNPYNTYKFKGLPPTPIGSPSLDSLEAAVEPTENPYLFYLADSHGTTYYSKTYQEHLRKKRLYIGG